MSQDEDNISSAAQGPSYPYIKTAAAAAVLESKNNTASATQGFPPPWIRQATASQDKNDLNLVAQSLSSSYLRSGMIPPQDEEVRSAANGLSQSYLQPEIRYSDQPTRGILTPMQANQVQHQCSRALFPPSRSFGVEKKPPITIVRDNNQPPRKPINIIESLFKGVNVYFTLLRNKRIRTIYGVAVLSDDIF